MLKGAVIDDDKLFNKKLQEWENFYNFERPHSSLEGRTPYERLEKRQNSVCNRSGVNQQGHIFL